MPWDMATQALHKTRRRLQNETFGHRAGQLIRSIGPGNCSRRLPRPSTTAGTARSAGSSPARGFRNFSHSRLPDLLHTGEPNWNLLGR